MAEEDQLAEDNPTANDEPTAGDDDPRSGEAPSSSPRWSPSTKNMMAVALVIASLTVLYLSRNVLALAALAGLIAFLVAPMIRLLHEKLKVPRGLALLISYLAVFTGVLMLGFLMVNGVVGAVSEIDITEAEDSLRSTATSTLESVREFTIIGYTVDLTDTVDPWLEDLRKDSGDSSKDKSSSGEDDKRLALSSNQLQSLFGGITSSVGTIGSTLLAAFMSGIITVLVAIYLNADSSKFREAFRRTVPAGHRGDIEKLGSRTMAIWRGYLYGQLLNSLVVGLLMWIVLWFIGLPGAFVFAVILGVLNMIPTFGPILAAIPAVLAALALGSTKLDWGNIGFAILVAVLYLIVVQLQANLMAPLITGRAVSLSPATVIIGLLVGVQVGGLVGAILVVPVIATGKEYGRYVIAKLTDGDPFPPRKPDRTDDDGPGDRPVHSQPA
jgi:predicted PurR-regulated permease PerM